MNVNLLYVWRVDLRNFEISGLYTHRLVTVQFHVESLTHSYFYCFMCGFQALQYLRKVCNHPLLVLTASHPEYNKVMDQLHQQNISIRDIQHAAKLVALK